MIPQQRNAIFLQGGMRWIPLHARVSGLLLHVSLRGTAAQVPLVDWALRADDYVVKIDLVGGART